MNRRDQLLRALAFVACIALAVGRVPEVIKATPISAANDLRPLVYPFLADEGPWRISQGYDGGAEHAPGDYQQLSLDFTVESGDPEGRTVVAPTSGTINWMDAGGATWSADAENCLSIKVDGDQSHYVAVCHVRFDRAYGVGDHVSRGERIGVIGAKDAGSAFPHVSLTLYTAESEQQAGLAAGRRAEAFVEPWSLSDCSYPDDGSSKSQYVGATGLPGSCPSGSVATTSAPGRIAAGAIP